MLRPIEWADGRLRLLDQTLLPEAEVWLDISDHLQLAEAIRSLRVRGAPAIGIAAGYGLALAAQASETQNARQLLIELRTVGHELAITRPTAVNLSWALRRVLEAAAEQSDVESMRAAVVEEAQRIHNEQIAIDMRLGLLGAGLLRDNATVLTHCNTGALATGGSGTALGIVRAAVEQRKRVRVYATETRPLLQGARLTAWELARDGIPCTLIVDGAAGVLMRRGGIDAVIVGADRIVANGDTANKVGTYALALIAREHGVPFYVAAPVSTIDVSLPAGDDIPIEERSPDEVLSIAGKRIAAEGVSAANPAFDITPHRLISAIVTEQGVIRPPFVDALRTQAARVEVHV